MRKPLLLLAMAFLWVLPALASAQVNTPPVADAGAGQMVFLGDFADLDGTATDADGDVITAWLWTVDASPAGSYPVLFNEFAASTVLDADLAGDYVMSLVAFDGTDWSLPDTVVITFAENLPPTAVASADVTTGSAPVTVQFDATQSFDPEGAPLMYAWSFGDGSVPVLGATPVHTYQTQGIFTAELTVQDERGFIDLDTIDIVVTAPNPPAVPLLGRFALLALAIGLALVGGGRRRC
jgi:PKD repeat protein